MNKLTHQVLLSVLVLNVSFCVQLYAVIGKDENRDKEVRRPRASIRRQLSETKQAQAPKKAPARTKKNELEV